MSETICSHLYHATDGTLLISFLKDLLGGASVQCLPRTVLRHRVVAVVECAQGLFTHNAHSGSNADVESFSGRFTHTASTQLQTAVRMLVLEGPSWENRKSSMANVSRHALRIDLLTFSKNSVNRCIILRKLTRHRRTSMFCCVWVAHFGCMVLCSSLRKIAACLCLVTLLPEKFVHD